MCKSYPALDNTSKETYFIVNDPDDSTIHRIFAYMVIISCLITTEFLRFQQNLPLSPDALREMDEVYQMCSNQTNVNNYVLYLRNEVLFLILPDQITIDKYLSLFKEDEPHYTVT